MRARASTARVRPVRVVVAVAPTDAAKAVAARWGLVATGQGACCPSKVCLIVSQERVSSLSPGLMRDCTRKVWARLGSCPYAPSETNVRLVVLHRGSVPELATAFAYTDLLLLLCLDTSVRLGCTWVHLYANVPSFYPSW